MLRGEVLLAAAAAPACLRAERGDAVGVALLHRERKAAQGAPAALQHGNAYCLARECIVNLEGVALDLGQALPLIIERLHGHPLIAGKAFPSHLTHPFVRIREKAGRLERTASEGRHKGRCKEFPG